MKAIPSILSRTVILLGVVSLFTDVASEMLYPVMPLYLESIGFPVAGIGVLEGIAAATAGLSKGYFGQWSDRLGRRRPFVQLGYGVSALAKPLMAAFTFPARVLFARTAERQGKGQGASGRGRGTRCCGSRGHGGGTTTKKPRNGCCGRDDSALHPKLCTRGRAFRIPSATTRKLRRKPGEDNDVILRKKQSTDPPALISKTRVTTVSLTTTS